MSATINNNSLRSIARLVLTASAFVITATQFVTDANAQIKNTRHNLSSSGAIANQNKTTDQGEICVFCHTPHGSATTAAAPLWNRKLANPASFTAYGATSTTLDGTVDLNNSVSLACLSCHDGTQAMDTVLNAPGSGGWDATNGVSMSATWTGDNQTSGKLKAGIVSNLGNDLSNDHPVGILYGTVSGDADFNAMTKHASKDIWWVDTDGGTAGRDKTDMILYTKGSQPYVECASCHDPHTANATFLRIQNTGSAVCLACHNK